MTGAAGLPLPMQILPAIPKQNCGAAAPCSQAGVAIYAGEQQLGSVEILPSRSMDDFQLYTIPLEPYTGQADLRLEITGMASVYRIQLG